MEWGQGARGGEHRNETLEYRDKRTFEPRKWKILGRTRDPSLCEKEALKPRKRKHWSPGKGKKNTETMKRNNGAFGNGHPRALEKENLKLGKRNVEGKKHRDLRKKETWDLLTKKPESYQKKPWSQ